MGNGNVSALAAGAAFQTLLTIFPALAAAVSLYGLVADRNMEERQIIAIQGVLPPEAITLIATWLRALVQAPATRFGLGLIVSVLLALWSIRAATRGPSGLLDRRCARRLCGAQAGTKKRSILAKQRSGSMTEKLW